MTGHPDHLLGDLLGFIGRSRHFNATALAATAGMDLRLDDNEVATQTAGDVSGFSSSERDLAARYGHPEAREN